MSLLHKIYKKLHYNVALPGEKGEYSSGVWQDAARKKVLDFLKGRSGRILEIGSGEGLFLAQLAKVAPDSELYGVDNDNGRLELSKKRLEVISPGISARLLFAEAPQLPFAEGYFDATICVNVSLALPSHSAVYATIAEMARITKKGGVCIFEYRNAGNPLLVLKYRLAPYYDETVKDHPFTMLKTGMAEKFLSSAGFCIKRRAYLPEFFEKARWIGRLSPIVVIEAVKI
ncbi:MAG TPA: class I SAM-dependent methyltransferase [Candidatus Omnitrophota bacterium]|nr:class I SAM-dependent methyltransferase [Candidatus Omnitrophota bacterium]